MHVCVCGFSCIHVSVCIYMYIYLHTYMYIYIYVHIHLCIYMYIYVCIHLCMHIYIYTHGMAVRGVERVESSDNEFQYLAGKLTKCLTNRYVYSTL